MSTDFRQKATLLFAILISLSGAVTGPIFIRYNQDAGMPSLIIITLRLLFTNVILTPFVWRKHHADIRAMSRSDWLKISGVGIIFAFNLIGLLFALEYTSVLVALILRRTSSLWIILFEAVLLGVVFKRRVWLGVIGTIVGSILVSLGTVGTIELGERPILGLVVALAGAICMGIYMTSSRYFKDRYDTLLYSWLVFLIANVVVFIISLLTQTPFTGYSQTAYLWVIAVAIASQFFGHIGLIYVTRYFSATVVSMIPQLAVVLSAVLALFVFSEIPTSLQILGSGVIILGVLLVSARRLPKGSAKEM